MAKEYKKFTEDERALTVQKICDEIAQGNPVTETLKAYNVVSWSTFQYWLNTQPELKALYKDAQLQRETFLFEEMLRIAYSESPKSVKKYRNGELVETVVKDSVEDRRLKINTIKWSLSKMNPLKFGELVRVEEETQPITTIRIIDADIDND